MILFDWMADKLYDLYYWWVPYSLNGGKALTAIGLIGLIVDSMWLHGFLLDLFALPLIVGAVSWRVIAPREGLC